MGRVDVRQVASSYSQRTVAADKIEGGDEDGEAACCMYLQAEALRPYIQSRDYFRYLKVHRSALVGDIGPSIGLMMHDGVGLRHGGVGWNGAKSDWSLH